MSYQVLARKWRPAAFDQVVGQEHVLKALTHALENNRLHHAYLFTGTRGVGKTSIARLLAKGLNCEQGVTATPCGQCNNCVEISQGRFVDLLEIDAASRTKVDDTREILDNVQYQPVRGRYKVYLIDEVHMLSRHSFNALLKTLEEPPEHVKFLLATTDPQKLPVTVLSRCLQFNLKSVTPKRISAHLAKVLDAEAIPYEPAALELLAQAADGSVRDGMSLTDQAIAHGSGRLDLAQVQGMLGTLDSGYAVRLLDSLCQGEPQQMLDLLDEIEAFAPDHDDLLRQMAAVLHQAALRQFNLKTQSHQLDEAGLTALAAQLDREQLQLWYQILTQGRKDLPLAPDPRSGVEMTLLRALAFAPAEPVSPMLARPTEAPTHVAAPQHTEAVRPAATQPDAAQSEPVQPEPVQPEPEEPEPEQQKPVQPESKPAVTKPEQAVAVAAEPEPAPAQEVAAQPAKSSPTPSSEPDSVAEEGVEAQALVAEQAHIEAQAQTPTQSAPSQSAPSTQAASSQSAAPRPDQILDPSLGYEPPPLEQDPEAMAAEQAMLMAQAEEMMSSPQMESAPPSSAPAMAPEAPAQPTVPVTDLVSQVLANQSNLRKRFGSEEPTEEAAAAATPKPAPTPAVSKRPAAEPAGEPQATEPEPAKRATEQATAPPGGKPEAVADAVAAELDRPPWHTEDHPASESQAKPAIETAAEPVAQPASPTAPVAEPVSPVEPEPVAEVAPVAMPEASEAVELDRQWYQAMAKLGIGARPRQLAINSVLEREGEQVVLYLRPDQRHLNNESVVAPLQQSLETLWQQSVQLRIEVADQPGRETPLEIRRRRHKEKLVQAREDLLADPAMIWLQNEMGASLIEESVNYQAPEGGEGR
ncbi:DNA polymerase III subunit gamma/tau [Ferrimonas marina]|uniref:DNA-directed DNA polymerase n=1 Tax=Ferrimonas marina TaxID=299255 RepID=A0A1M5RMI0_9GAMM|nr:DNA polymerase III subunit gamma/tau [Ferrimonas marina]SHH27103.1 DNA polymerase-3 subunit gamma/tau [Ferrimonas marina]